MLQALAQLDNEQPCVALFDEIEKVFASKHGEHDSGTTTTMLSQAALVARRAPLAGADGDDHQ